MTAHGLRRWSIVFVVFCALCAGQAATAQIWWEPPEKGKGPVDQLRVDAAIRLGVEHVKQKQRANGSFPGHDQEYPMGMTALCLLAMVKSGVQPSDPAVRKALDYLRYLPFKKTYSTGCLLMALEALHPPNAKKWAAAGAKFLLETRQEKRGGTWGYPTTGYEKTGDLGRPDLSNTQYAVLGLRSARRLGVKIPAEAFTDVVEFLTDDQRDLGAFRYEKRTHEGTGSMTTAALAIIAIAEEAVGKSSEFRRVRGDARQAFKNGMKWFEKNYTVEWNPRGDDGARNKAQLAYYLYGIERLCDIRGIKAVDGHDWYGEGARFLLANQGHDRSWGRLENTCFALLFLNRSFLYVSREIRSEAVAARRRQLQQRRGEWAARNKTPDPARVPYVREWLVLGPFPVKDGNPLDLRRHPRPRGKPATGAVGLSERWQRYSSPTDAVDLEALMKKGNRRLAYVATHFRAAGAEDVLLWLGTRDAWRVWVNGKEVQSRLVHGTPGKDRWRIPCRFRKGYNTVVVLLEDHARDWIFHFRISDAGGEPVPDLLSATSTTRLKRMVKAQHD